jgi:predicted nucleic acid-binding protein
VAEAVGVVDTNVFVHARTSDAQSGECRRFLRLVERGEAQMWLDPLVVHELSYVLSRGWPGVGRQRIGAYLRQLLDWPGVLAADADLLRATLDRWSRVDGLGFVDAYLVELAGQRGGAPIYSKNVRQLRAQGARVPDPLPGG